MTSAPGWMPGSSASTTSSTSTSAETQITITSHHDAEGPIRWTEILTLGFPDGSYRITGYSYVWWSESDLESFGFCELDLRAGTGTIQQNGQPVFELLIEIPALPATMWATTEKVMPIDCP